MQRPEKAAAPAVTRAIAILDVLEAARGRALGVSELARELGIAKSSTSNLCVALEEGGLIRRVETGYLLGRRTVELGGAYLAGFDQVREFYRVCADTPALARELVQIAILDGVHVLYLARHEGQAPLRLTAGIGDRYPASLTAVGNALLAQLTDEELRERFAAPETRPRVTAASVTDLDGLLDKIRETRLRGYGLDEGEMFPSVTGVAIVIPPRNAGDLPLALGVSMMGVAPGDPRREEIVAALNEASGLLRNPLLVGLEK